MPQRKPKEEQIAKATGETQRFLSVYKEYIEDKDVTRRRLYLETMEEVLEGMDKVLLEENAKGGSGVWCPISRLTNCARSAAPTAVPSRRGSQQ